MFKHYLPIFLAYNRGHILTAKVLKYFCVHILSFIINTEIFQNFAVEICPLLKANKWTNNID